MPEQHKPKRVRSPSYPSIDLESAVDKLRTMFEFTHRTPILISVMLPHWGFESGKSANGMKTVSALKSYGLIDDQGQTEKRKVSITETGFKILNLIQGSPERKELIKEATLAPDMYRYMWDNFDELPHFDSVQSHLVVEKKFNKSAVKGFLDDYKHSIKYAELSKYDNIDAEDSVKDSDDIEANVDVGDLVQWESGGILQFQQPKKVRAIQEHDGKPWVFVEGSDSGLPMNQIIVESKGSGSTLVPPMLKEISVASEREWIRGPLSKETWYRIIVSGDLGPKEIGKMIRLLEAQRDILSDDE